MWSAGARLGSCVFKSLPGKEVTLCGLQPSNLEAALSNPFGVKRFAWSAGARIGSCVVKPFRGKEVTLGGLQVQGLEVLKLEYLTGLANCQLRCQTPSG